MTSNLFKVYLNNFGTKATLLRSLYEFYRVTGLLKFHFPVKTQQKVYDISLLKQKFLFWKSDNWHFKHWDLHTHKPTEIQPITGNQESYIPPTYKASELHVQHWSTIRTLCKNVGDIKLIWESSRFSFIYPLLREELQTKKDNSIIVQNSIVDWIENNPVNKGPNWVCSQEISIRVLNWTYALHFYNLKFEQGILQKILNSLDQQVCHINTHLLFSRNFVDNNHLLSESLSLYIIGNSFPLFSESPNWHKRGKVTFEKAIQRQFSQEGTYCQNSLNYHRLALQLLSWYIRYSQVHSLEIPPALYQIAEKASEFLMLFTTPHTGWAPNYGPNDSSLPFSFIDQEKRDFRPQINSLYQILGKDIPFPLTNSHESLWYGMEAPKASSLPPANGLFNFFENGYSILREHNTLTFIRCTQHIHRPYQSDNLHLDIWVDDENILRDSGTYSYNTSEEIMNYYEGNAGHNVVSVQGANQMKKVSRFLWDKWTDNVHLKSTIENGQWYFSGGFTGFYSLHKKGIIHKRTITKKVGELKWIIEDTIENKPTDYTIEQLWHPNETFFENFFFTAKDHSSDLSLLHKTGFISDNYNEIKEIKYCYFESKSDTITTIISPINKK